MVLHASMQRDTDRLNLSRARLCSHRATRRDRLPEGPACVTLSSSGALGLLTTIAQSMERIVEGRQGGRQAPQRVRSTVEDH